MSQEIRFQIMGLTIWAKKFAPILARLQSTTLQKITATSNGEVVLGVYKPKDDGSSVILSMKTGFSGAELSNFRPQGLPFPNSLVQMARKHLMGRRIKFAYAIFDPPGIVLEFEAPKKFPLEKNQMAEDIPNCLILALEKPPRIILAKKNDQIPYFYKKMGLEIPTCEPFFFESFCEWDEQTTKTKRRPSFTNCPIAYCPLHLSNGTKDVNEKEVKEEVTLIKQSDEPQNWGQALLKIPTPVRRAVRTRLQFLERKEQRQKIDLPRAEDIDFLEKQSLWLKNHLHEWPAGALNWQAPLPFSAVYHLKPGEKPSSLLEGVYKKIHVLKRRREEILVRLQQTQEQKKQLADLVLEAGRDVFQAQQKYAHLHHVDSHNSQQKQNTDRILTYALQKEPVLWLHKLCEVIGITFSLQKKKPHKPQTKESRLPYKSFLASSGHFIRVARSAADGDALVRLMPSHHIWLHVLVGEGAHVWLEKQRGEKTPPAGALQEAAILAVHYSTHSKAKSADVQWAQRAFIEKKKNLPMGKVLVRRSESFFVKYVDNGLKKILDTMLQ